MRTALTPACFPGGGGGHVVRCLALARALQRQGAACGFVVDPPGVDLLRRLGWAGEVLAADDEAARLATIRALAPEAVVVDDYRLDAAFERDLPGAVMVIDDLADRPHACALLLDSAYGRADGDYAALAPRARLLLGPPYALLREGFVHRRRRPVAEVSRVFLCFGLSDVGGVAARAAALLQPLAPDVVFEVATAADAPSVPRLQAMANERLVLHLDADVAPLMHRADLAVGAGGGMVWERRAAGLPQLVVFVAENQRPTVERLAADGVIAAVDLADPDFEARLASAFLALRAVAARREQIDSPFAECDGRGAARAAEALIALAGV